MRWMLAAQHKGAGKTLDEGKLEESLEGREGFNDKLDAVEGGGVLYGFSV